MILPAIRRLREAHARRRVHRATRVSVHPSAKVLYRGISYSPPAALEIGEGSMFQGSIAADRPQAEVRIGARTFIGGSMLVCAERITIGDDVLISWGCTILDHQSHALDWADRAGDVAGWIKGEKDWSNVRIRPVAIGDKVWIGFNAIVLPGITIGEGAVVGAGSVVTRDVAPWTVVAGNPARVVRTLDPSSPRGEP